MISHATINRKLIKQYQQITTFISLHELNLCKQQCFVLIQKTVASNDQFSDMT